MHSLPTAYRDVVRRLWKVLNYWARMEKAAYPQDLEVLIVTTTRYIHKI